MKKFLVIILSVVLSMSANAEDKNYFITGNAHETIEFTYNSDNSVKAITIQRKYETMGEAFASVKADTKDFNTLYEGKVNFSQESKKFMNWEITNPDARRAKITYYYDFDRAVIIEYYFN